MKASPANTPWSPERLDVRALAQASGQLAGAEPLTRFDRLVSEMATGSSAAQVAWRAQGELRLSAKGGESDIWLHLTATVSVPLQCQRCLGPVDTPLGVDRWFRFVADEASAEAQDDESEEDVLALEPRFSLFQLIEDELLMALPLVPMHEICPVAVVMQVQDPAIDALPAESQAVHPFASLAKLKTQKKNSAG